MMTMTTLLGSIEVGIIYALMTLGIYISYKILNVADLTVDGSFTLGAAVSIMCTLAGYPLLGLILGAGAGGLAGLATAILQTKLGIQSILSGILTMTGLYTVNLWVMEHKPNVSLIGLTTFFDGYETLLGKKWGGIVAGLIVVSILFATIAIFLKTPLGLALRATGDNEMMVCASSINVNLMKTIGLVVANALVGASGALMGQNQKFADVNMGVGMVVMGLASLIIGELTCVRLGERMIKRTSIILHILGVLIGAILYRLIIAQALAFNFSAGSMKLVSAVIITCAIAYPKMKNNLHLRLRRCRHQQLIKEDVQCSK